MFANRHRTQYISLDEKIRGCLGAAYLKGLHVVHNLKGLHVVHQLQGQA